MENNNNTGLKVTLIIFIILFLASGGYILYDKVINSEKCLKEDEVVQKEKLPVEKTEDPIEEKTEDPIEEKTEDPVNQTISVVEALSFSDAYYGMFNVKLPEIVGNTNTIKKLNKKILNETLPGTYTYPLCHAIEENDMNKGASVDYKYLTKDNILVIYIYSEVPAKGNACSASNGGLSFHTYFYDIKNDKILTMKTVAEKFNMKLNGLTTRNDKPITSYDQLEDNSYIIIIENGKLEFNQLF